MRDAVLVNPPAGGNFLRELNRCSKRSMIGEVWPQTALAYLSSILMRGGFSTDVIDCIAEQKGCPQLITRLKRDPPRFAVLLVSTTTFYNDAKVARTIREEVGCFVCAVGAHVTALPFEALSQGFDFVIRGEAELALLDLVRGRPPETINGVCFLRNGKFVGNGVGALVDSLDSLGAPDRSQLPNSRYRMPLFRGSFATIIPTRGCPYNCAFCRTKAFYGASFRMRSPLNVANEVSELHGSGTRNFFFQADTFTASRRWVLEFCRLLRQEHLDISWAANSRVDRFGKDVANAMVSAGCRLVTFGVESGSQRILDSVGKGITPSQSLRAVRNARFAGMLSAAHFILGLPDDDAGTIAETIRFSQTLRPNFAVFNYATPYPGTRLRALMEREGCILTNDWSCYDNFHSNIVRTKYLGSASLAFFMRKTRLMFYLNPGYLGAVARSAGHFGMVARIGAGFIRQQASNLLTG